MQFLNTIAFASLAAYVLADQTFTLNAKGGDIDTPVTLSGAIIGLENGSPFEVDLHEPSGYATINGKYVSLTPGGIMTTLDKSEASKDFGVDDGKLRSGPSEDRFWACKAGTGYTLQNFQKDGCTEVALLVTLRGETSTSASESSKPTSSAEPTPSTTKSVEPTPSTTESAKPTSDETETKTESTSTLVTITSCGPDVTDCPVKPTPPPVSTENGAAAVQVGAGLMVVAAAAMLV